MDPRIDPTTGRMAAWCSLHSRHGCDLCDECGHPAADHINGHDLPGWAAATVFAAPTCWAENVCRQCDPERHARVLQVVAIEAAR